MQPRTKSGSSITASREETEILHAQQQEISQLKERLSQIEKILSSGVVNDQGRSTNSQGN